MSNDILLRGSAGLDPAGPMFSVKTTQRIKPESATFVDVIHTCGTGLGLYDAVGHVDFYPNRGKFKQPGCGYSFGMTLFERNNIPKDMQLWSSLM